jgi:outer membrane PBP1 activator LpoA protein
MSELATKMMNVLRLLLKDRTTQLRESEEELAIVKTQLADSMKRERVLKDAALQAANSSMRMAVKFLEEKSELVEQNNQLKYAVNKLRKQGDFVDFVDRQRMLLACPDVVETAVLCHNAV